MRPLTRAFDLEKWRRLEPSEVKSNLRELQLAAATVDEAAREKARLELARFSFANGLAHEATGVLSRIAEDRPAITDEPEFRTLRGAAFFIMNQIPEAEADLTHPSLEGLDEAAFWLAALRASGGDAVGAAPTLKRTSGIIRPYPTALKVPLGLIVSETAIEMGDVDEAENQLEFLGVDPPGPIQKAKIGFVQGRLSELSGDFEGAVGKWEEVMQGPDRSSRAKAAFARAELLRVEFFWSERNWPRAAQSLRRLVQAMELSSAAALDDRGGRLILNLAIALTLSGNGRSVDRLRTDFGEAMDGTSFRDAFRLIASPQTQGLLDYRTIANKVADVEQFREFVASYRQGLPGDIPINPN